MYRLKFLREQKSLNMKQAAKALNLPYTTYVGYEKGQREPNSEFLIKAADFYNTTTDFILGATEKNAALNTPHGFDPIPNTYKAPRLGVISCGDPIMSEENFEGYDDVPDNIKCDFTLKCEGDSMIGARINDGDIVYIRQQPIIESGQIAAVLVDGTEKLLKRVYMTDSTITLQAENPAYAPLTFIGEDMNRVSIIGLAVAFTSTIK